MASRRVKIPDLALTLEKIMEEYQNDIRTNVREITQKVAGAGAKQLRAVSHDEFGTSDREKPYSKGWTVENASTRLTDESIIWNTTNPGLVHLLEYGHAIKRGGRTVGEYKGKEHVTGIAEKLTTEYEEGVLNVIRRYQ